MPRRSTWDRDQVRAAASTQHDLITAAQLAELGVPRSTVYRSNQLGLMFSLVLPGVHIVDGPRQLTTDQRDMASLLYAGPSSQLTGPRALRRRGVRAVDRPEFAAHGRVHVLIPHERKRASHGFVQVERTVHLPRPVPRDGFDSAPMARAVLDAARRCTDQAAVRDLVFEVVQRRLVTPDELEAERHRGQIRGSRFARLALEQVFAGVRSVPEGAMRTAFVSAGVTSLLYNPTLHLPDGGFLASPDVYDEASGVCLEVDSREYHFDVHSWEATMRRHARMTSAGLAVLHVPPSRIGNDAPGVVDEFLRAVEVRAGWPRPDVRVRRIAREG